MDDLIKEAFKEWFKTYHMGMEAWNDKNDYYSMTLLSAFHAGWEKSQSNKHTVVGQLTAEQTNGERVSVDFEAGVVTTTSGDKSIKSKLQPPQNSSIPTRTIHHKDGCGLRDCDCPSTMS